MTNAHVDASIGAPDGDAALRVLRIVAPLGAAAMSLAVVAGLMAAPAGAAGDFLANVWGRVTTIDLYLALGAAALWIGWRERSAAKTAAWSVTLITTGSIGLWLYVALAARRATSVVEVLVGPNRS